MDVAVSGSTGLLGSALCDALRRRGDNPVPLLRPGSPSGEGVRWDPVRGEVDVEGLEGVGAVVHLAGEPLLGRWTAAKRRRIRDSRVEGTRLLATTLAGLQRPPAVMLSASGVGWYGSRGDEVLTEESGPGSGFMAEVCQAWEDAARPAAEAGIRLVHLRTGLVQSPDADLLRLQLPAFRVGLGARLGSGRQWFAWISIDDHVRAMLHLLGDDRGAGPFNLAAPNPVRNAEYAATLGRVLRRPAVLTVPPVAVTAVFGAELTEGLATASQRAVPAGLTELGFSFAHPTLEEALRAVLRR